MGRQSTGGGSRQLGARIRKLRLERGLTQSALAEPYYTAAHISQIEAGKRRASSVALEHVASKLGIEVDELVTGRPRRLGPELELRVQQAKQAIAGGDFAEASQAARQVVASARRHALPRLQAKGEEVKAFVAERRGDVEGALRHFEQAERLWDAEPIHLRFESVAGTARCHQALGDVRYAIHLLETYLLELKKEHGDMSDPTALMRTHSALVAAYADAGFIQKATEAASEAARLEPQVADLEQLACMNMNVAGILLYQGQINDAIDSLRKAEHMFASLGWKHQLARANIARGIIDIEKGNYEDARSALTKAVQLLATSPRAADKAQALNELARAERLSGNMDAAWDHLVEALPLLSDSDFVERAQTHREMARCLAEQDVDRAEEELRRSVHLYRLAKNSAETAQTLKELGDLLRDKGKFREAAETYRDGLDATEEERSGY